MGETPEVMHLIESIQDVESLELQSENLVYMTQTTLSVDDTAEVIAALKKKYPHITTPPTDSICYATTNRQQAVKDLAPRCDLILVIGAQNSSNSQRLREVAESCGTRAFLIDNELSIRDEWFDGVETVGLSAGASAPEILVERVVENLKKRGAHIVEQLETIPENVFFPLPKELQTLPMALANS